MRALSAVQQDEELARQLVELGYRGSGETLKREEFEARKKAEREKHLRKDNAPKPLFSMGKDLSAFPFLQALANREELVRNGKLTVSFARPARRRCRCLRRATDTQRLCSPSSSSATPTPRGRR